MASGVSKVVALDYGGAYAHPHLPSTDIVADLRANVFRFKLADRVDIIEGYARSRRSLAKLNRLAPNVDLISIDADAWIALSLWAFAPFLADGCIVAIDDYESDAAPEKSRPIRSYIAKALARGMLEQFAVVPWGTWVGRYRRIPAWRRLLYRAYEQPWYGARRLLLRHVLRPIRAQLMR